MTHKIILLKDHPSALDKTAKLIESTARTGKLGIYKVRGGYLACLEYPNCIAGLFDTEEQARKAQQKVTDSV